MSIKPTSISLQNFNQPHFTKSANINDTNYSTSCIQPADEFVSSLKTSEKQTFKERLKNGFVKNSAAVSNLFKKSKFYNNKQFNTPIDIDKYYQKMVKKLKNIQIETVFDEKTVTDSEIKIYLENIGYWSSVLQSKINLVRNNPNLLHALNLLSGLNYPEIMISGIEFLDNLDINTPSDEIENLIKYIVASEQNCHPVSLNALYDIAKGGKTLLALNCLFNETKEKIFSDKSKYAPYSDFITHFGFDKNESSNKSVDEFLLFLGSLKKETLKKSSKSDLSDLFGGISFDDFKAAKEFYESLGPDVLKKINLENLQKLLEIKDKPKEQILEILNTIPKKILLKLDSYELPTYVEFSEFYGLNSINQLSVEQKRRLLKILVESGGSTFESSKSVSKILPANQQEYCTLMDKLTKSIGVSTEKLSSEELKNFDKAIQDISENIKNVDFNIVSFELDFPREKFIEEVEAHLQNLNCTDKIQVMDYFGFEIKDGKLKGYPMNINNGQKLNEVSSRDAKKAIIQLRPIVEMFSSKDNKITVKGASSEFNESVNKIFESFPELKTMVQKKQHNSHIYTLDTHVFKVLQGVCLNPKFKQLSDDDKKVLVIASLLHDITKAEGVMDFMHPVESAFDAYYIIQKLNLTEAQQLKIYELIKTHNWLQLLDIARKNDMVENVAQDIAFDSRHTNTFEMAKILCEADLKAIRDDDSFFETKKDFLYKMSLKIDGYINKLHQTQIVLPQTKIPKASEIVGETRTFDGIKNTVFYMDSADFDLSKYGFAPGTTKDNWTALVHALDDQEQMSKLDTFNIIDTEALLSTSFINPEEYKVFRNQGLILDVDYNDIHAGYETDFGTGYEKTLEVLKEDYLFYEQRKKTTDSIWRYNRSKYRNFISEKIREKMNLTPSEYYERIKKIQDCKSLTDIEKADKELSDALLSVFNNMQAKKRYGGRQYNEMLVSRPKIQGVFAYDKDYFEIPIFLRKYAADNDIPIIIFGNF